MRIRGDGRFWGRMAGQALIVNLPLAWALAMGAIGTTVAFALSAVLAVATLALWDGTRRSHGEPEPALVQAPVARAPKTQHTAALAA